MIHILKNSFIVCISTDSELDRSRYVWFTIAYNRGKQVHICSFTHFSSTVHLWFTFLVFDYFPHNHATTVLPRSFYSVPGVRKEKLN